MNNMRLCKILKGTKSFEEYMKDKHVDFSDYTGWCNEKEYNSSSENETVYVEFDEKSIKKLPQKYIKDGENLGYKWTAYTFFKNQIELL